MFSKQNRRIVTCKQNELPPRKATRLTCLHQITPLFYVTSQGATQKKEENIVCGGGNTLKTVLPLEVKQAGALRWMENSNNEKDTTPLCGVWK